MRGSKVHELAIVSLVLGILSFINLFGLEKALLAVIVGVIALRRIAAPESTLKGEGFAAGGIVLGGISAVVSVLFIMRIIQFIQQNPELLKSFLEKGASLKGIY